MHTVNDVRKLAQILLKDGRIDRNGFDHVSSRLAEIEKSEKVSVKNGARPRLSAPGAAIRLLSEMGVPVKGEKKGVITEEDVAKSVAKNFKIPFRKIDPLDLDIDIVTRTISKPFALKSMILPMSERDGALTVAIVDPENVEALDGLGRATGRKIKAVMSTPGDIVKIIHEFFGFKDSVVKADERLKRPEIDLGNLEQLDRLKSPDQIPSDDEHIKNAVDYLFHYAFDLRASDIHIEPKREESLVRFRIDGILSDIYTIPKVVHQAITSRIKMLARLNIAERRRPQDGRIKVEYGEGKSELRVSTMPTAFGEKVVMRALRPDTLLMELDSLGMFPEDLIKIQKFLTRPYGMVLVTGPTGSGKTTTLYSALNFVSGPNRNIVTVEDPIEIVCDKFNQMAVQPSIGLTFASSLRTILRQDPDIIMVGEIRDFETAENAIQAALTGHLVLSTLHTNDTTSSVTRLLDLGIQPFLINNTVIGIVAQRLVRLNCPHCAVEKVMTRENLARFGVHIREEKAVLKEGKGCEKCRYTGYLDRTGVYEVLEVTDEIKRMIQRGEPSMSIRAYALANGMAALKDDATRKMLAGRTTLQEVLRLGYQL